ncbi:patatin-like phospholipase family protein [Chitinivibrio alkaliphilus]|uniref:PNPLA domain-containing protein n=1 Tax=Chitinivibrio alkaliphilus ACht1 TaxID=1313304 RepID=U7D2L0_9BACT|nr:patatin-like phospholipase family protein [Chitinivibrio alkaliphilus]ERP30744.1 hypothetical protein CALK_2435 [Chitinivibrio alkaliphilus ACht1]
MLKDFENRKIGLVFSGGGGKGAYQIGVWKALREYNIDKYVKAVAGTSVGALNSALFATIPCERAESIWKNISQDQILAWKPEKIITTIAASKIAGAAMLATHISPILLATAGFGWFSQDGLKRLIENSLDFDKFRDTIPVHVCATSFPQVSAEYRKINDLSPEEIKSWLLASAAIPIVFNPIEIEGQKYYDGGVLDNTPVQQVLEYNPEFVFVVHLANDANTERSRQQAGNKRIWNIVPSENVGGLIDGTMNFTPEKADKLIQAGYTETMKVLQDLYDFMLSEKRFTHNAELIGDQHNSFKTLISQNKMIRNAFPEKLITENEQMNSLEFTIAEWTGGYIEPAPLSVGDVSEVIEKQISDGEKAIIEDAVDTLIDEMKDNSDELIKEAFNGITTLAATPGKIRLLYNQGFWKRIWNNLTGKNQKIQGGINADFHRAIYANQKMIQKLSERSALTLEAMVGLGNKINLTMSHVNNLYGKQRLQNQALQKMREITGKAILALNDKIEKVSDRVKSLEGFKEIQIWRGSLSDNSRGKSIVEKVHYFVESYAADLPELKKEIPLPYFRSALREMEIIDRDLISPAVHISYIHEHKNDALFSSNNKYFPMNNQDRIFFPVLSGVQEYMDGHKSIEKVAEVMQKEYGSDILASVPAVDYVTEMIAYFNKDQKETKKKGYLGILKNLEKICRENNFDKTVERIQKTAQDIQSFKAKVPLIGRFSAGKSKLLNAWLNRDVLGVDTAPTTALATELHYGIEEKAVLHYSEGEEKTCEVAEIPKDPEECKQIEFVELYLNNPRLKLWKDIVIVDMPGIDSNTQAHTKAVGNYAKNSSFFIAVAAPADAFNASLLHFIDELDSYNVPLPSFILSRKYMTHNINKIQKEFSKEMEKRLLDPVFVGVVESDRKHKDINDFEKIIGDINDTMDDLVKRRFSEEIEQLQRDIANKLKALINTGNLPAKKIEADIETLTHEKVKMKRKFASVCEKVSREMVEDGSNEIIEEATKVVNANLHSIEAAYSSGSIESTITSLIRPILIRKIEEIRNKAAQELDIALGEARDNLKQYGGSPETLPAITSEPSGSKSATITVGAAGAGIGFMVGGPVGGIIGGLVGGVIGLFAGKKDREDESRNKAAAHQLALQSVRNIAATEMERQAQHLISEAGRQHEQMILEKEEELVEMKKSVETTKHEFEKKQISWKNELKQLGYGEI